MKKTLIALALTVGAAAGAMAQDIVDTAVKAGIFKTLVAAVQAVGRFDFETIVPCHFGTFPLIDQTPDLFLSAMGDQAGRVKVADIGVPFAA